MFDEASGITFSRKEENLQQMPTDEVQANSISYIRYGDGRKPFPIFVNTNISDVKRKATRLSDNYMLNFGGGFSSVFKEKSSPTTCQTKADIIYIIKVSCTTRTPKALRRILRHLGKRKQVLSSFWLRQVEKWKTRLYLCSKHGGKLTG